VTVEGKRQTWSLDLSTLLRMGQCIRVSGYETAAKDSVFRSGPTELSMRADGSQTRQMGEEFFGTLMATFSMASGKKTKRMALAPTPT